MSANLELHNLVSETPDSRSADPSSGIARLRVLDSNPARPRYSDFEDGNPLYTTANTLSVGSVAEVVSISASCSELRHKLLSLGVVAGTRLEVSGLAPLKDPMNVKLLGFTLSLRLCEAECIRVKRVL